MGFFREIFERNAVSLKHACFELFEVILCISTIYSDLNHPNFDMKRSYSSLEMPLKIGRCRNSDLLNLSQLQYINFEHGTLFCIIIFFLTYNMIFLCWKNNNNTHHTHKRCFVSKWLLACPVLQTMEAKCAATLKTYPRNKQSQDIITPSCIANAAKQQQKSN